jgi:predicted homoserine dehydrogenase-like protein
MTELTPLHEQESGNSLNARRPSAGRTRRVALLGAGYIADWHALALQSVEGVELVAVCDYSIQAKAQALARKFGIPRVYASLEAMLAAEKLDAVHILCLPIVILKRRDGA